MRPDWRLQWTQRGNNKRGDDADDAEQHVDPTIHAQRGRAFFRSLQAEARR